MGSPGSGPPITFDFSGSSALDGTDGNIRTFTAGGVSVKASAFSRDKSTGAWSTAFLGSYGGGLGVTDSSEGTAATDTHTVDNVGRDNYVLFEFSEKVVVDSAFLGYVVDDSDLTVWIGTMTDPFNNHQTLSDAFLASLGFTEVNLTDLTTTRTADLNAGNFSGNVRGHRGLDGRHDAGRPVQDREADGRKPATGIYENKGTVTVPGDTDSDLSHYKNPEQSRHRHREDHERSDATPTRPRPTTTTRMPPNGPGVPILTPGSTVTWTYKVTNTGNVAFTVQPGRRSSTTTARPATPPTTSAPPTAQITFDSAIAQRGDGDNILEPGEVWLYKATGTVQNLTALRRLEPRSTSSGSSALDGAGRQHPHVHRGLRVGQGQRLQPRQDQRRLVDGLPGQLRRRPGRDRQQRRRRQQQYAHGR